MVTLSDAGKAKLDALLADQVVNANIPAIFNGITTAEGDIYFNCGGKKNEGDASEGEVNDKTSKCCDESIPGTAVRFDTSHSRSSSAQAALTPNPPAVVDDQAHHLHCLSPACGEGPG